MKNKILLVEDEAPFREIVAEVLINSGFEVQQAEDGVAALAILFAGFEPDWVISDINMPNMDGLELCREIRRRSNVPILLCSIDDRALIAEKKIAGVKVLEKSPADILMFLKDAQLVQTK